MFQRIVQEAKAANLTVVDCANQYKDTVLLTDDQLINKIRQIVKGQATILLNLELFIGPRLRDGFLEQFVRKMAAEEPRYAVIVLFYSDIIFKKFDQFYQRNPFTQSHTLDLSEENYPEPQ